MTSLPFVVCPLALFVAGFYRGLKEIFVQSTLLLYFFWILNCVGCLKRPPKVGKMVHQVMLLVTKPDYVSLTLRTHIVKDKTDRSCPLTSTHVSINTKYISVEYN